MQNQTQAGTQGQAQAQAQGRARLQDQIPSQANDMCNNAFIVSGLSAGSCRLNSLVFIGVEETQVTKLKKKSVPKQESGFGESCVVL